MTPEERSEAASLASRARWSGVKETRPAKSPFKQSKTIEGPLQEISAIFEKRMEELGQTEEEKNRTVAEFAAFVDAKVAASLRAKQQEQLRSRDSRERVAEVI